MAGVCDIQQRLCLALALWNGRDPILKERMFGLTGSEGNHGEDAKDYWWYLDALPSHAWLRWRYHYPQQAFPYADLVDENRRRGKADPEYELLDTGVFEQGYWVVEATYAKAGPDDLVLRVTAKNAGPAADRLHVLPTLWFRNTWSWEPGAPRPGAAPGGRRRRGRRTRRWATYRLAAGAGPGGAPPVPLFCDNETNVPRALRPGRGAGHALPQGRHQRPRGDRRADGQPGPARDQGGLVVHRRRGPGRDGRVPPPAARRRRAGPPRPRTRAPEAILDALGPGWAGEAADALLREREAEADAFYATLTPADATPEEARVLRQAFAGMIWSKQYYAYDVTRWLDGDPGQPPPPAQRRRGRNAAWRHLDAADIFSMPDPWEYPWFAAWDLAFHAVTLAYVDPTFAKYQLIAVCREWFMHPNGALPAYEWAFDDVNPPVHAWAAAMVYLIDGAARPGLPGPRVPEAAAELHLVGQPQGRRGQQPLRGGLPGPGQHRPLRPLAPPGEGRARAVRRHGLDGPVLPGHAAHRPRAGARGPLLRGAGDQVPRALRPDLAGDEPLGAVGRDRRLLLRPPGGRRERADRAALQVDRGGHPGPGGAGGGRQAHAGQRRGRIPEALRRLRRAPPRRAQRHLRVRPGGGPPAQRP